MAWLNSTVTPQMAIERGWVTWDVYLSNWALASTGQDANSLQFPSPATQASIPSINGVMIGPYSDFDRVKIQFNPNIPVTEGSFAVPLNFINEKLLSVESPITYPLGAPITVNYDINASIGDSPNATFIADDGSNTVTQFNFAGPSIAPILHLVFFLQNTVVQPLRRYPKNFAEVIGCAAGTFFQRAIPIMGRKQGRLMFNNSGTDVVTVRVGLIGPRDRINDRTFETTLTTIVVNPNGTESFTFGGDIHESQFISIWTTCAPGDSTILYCNFEFTDIPGGGCTCITPPPT